VTTAVGEPIEISAVSELFVPKYWSTSAGDRIVSVYVGFSAMAVAPAKVLRKRIAVTVCFSMWIRLLVDAALYY
jgi:hypothetical protein